MDVLYKKTFRLLKPYWGRLIMASVSAMLFSAMSGAFIWMIGPLLGTIFNVSTPMSTAPVMTAPTSQVETAIPASTDQTFLQKVMAAPDKVKVWIKRQVDYLIVRPSKPATLVRICWVALVIAFL
jgi:ABC-type multidrug transport system fused ATPase/permease subunit